MYLISYSGSWNDEISVDGFAIISINKKNRIVKFLKNCKETIYINNGDDDEIEYDNGNELLDEINFDKIDSMEIQVIDKFFGKYNDYGYNFLLNLNKLDNNLKLI